MSAVLELLLVNAYWFSMPLAGYGLLCLLHRSGRLGKTAQVAVSLVLEQHLFVRFFLSFAVMAIAMAVIALPLYLLHLPALTMTLAFVALSGLGLGYLIILLVGNLFDRRDIDFFKTKGQALIVKVIFLGLCSLILVDFTYALYVKAYVLNSADSYVHLSRIVTILQQGFTFDSGFFSGLPESGYHYNVVYSYYIPPVQLFGMQPFEVWQYSFAFFRVVIWASIFSLAWYVSRAWLKDRFNTLLAATLATIFCILYYGGFFITAMYPNQQVFAWLILFVIALSLYEYRKISYIVMVLVAFLIAMTHPTYSLMTFIFVGLFVSVRLLFEKNKLLHDKEKILAYGSVMGVLILAPLRTQLFPLRTSGNDIEVPFPITHVGPLSIRQPLDGLHPSSIMLLLLGLFGLFYVLYMVRKSRQQLALVLALILFYPILVYEPIGFGLLQAVLPLWVVDRFTSMNVLGIVSIPLGVYGLLWVAKRQQERFRIPTRIATYRFGVIIAAFSITMLTLLSVNRVRVAYAHIREENEHYYAFMTRTYNSFHEIFKDDKIVVATPGDSYFLASIMPIKVLTIEYGHMTPAADIKNRQLCEKAILDKFNYSDLKTINASYVALAAYATDYAKDRKVADSKSYLKPVAGNGDFYVYEFRPDIKRGISSEHTNACVEFKNVEKS